MSAQKGKDDDRRCFTAQFKAQQCGVFMEDIAVLEAQQRSIDANPRMKLRAYAIDGGGVRARRMIETARALEPAVLGDLKTQLKE